MKKYIAWAVVAVLIMLCLPLQMLVAIGEAKVYSEMNIREDILSAMRESRRLSGTSLILTSEGGWFFQSNTRNYAYAYYGEDIEGLYVDGTGSNIVAMLKDGQVLNGTTLISGDRVIRDICWDTYINVAEAFMLDNEGNVYRYAPFEEDSLVSRYTESPVSAISCALGNEVFFYRDGGIYASLCQGSVDDETMDYWKGARNIVVGTCERGDGSEALNTIAGIDADGQVYATGRLANEILTMGRLSYIVMDHEGKLVVGLTPEGDLRLAGECAQNIVKPRGRVRGLRLFDDTLWYVDEEGVIYSQDIVFDQVHQYTPEETVNTYDIYYISPDGSILYTDHLENSIGDSRYRFSLVEMMRPDFSDHNKMLMYLSLLSGKMSRSYQEPENRMDISDFSQLSLFDFDLDGVNEIVLNGEYDSRVAHIHNGRLEQIGDAYPEQVCSEAGIFVCADPYARWNDHTYYSMCDGIARLFARSEFNSELQTTVYTCPGRSGDRFHIDALGERLREALNDQHVLAEIEFEAMLKEMLGDHVLREPSFDWFDNDRAAIGKAIFGDIHPDQLLKQQRTKSQAEAIDWDACNIGDRIAFGRWEQDAIDNGLEPIEWIVVEKKDGAVLLLSKDIIDAQPYFTDQVRFYNGEGGKPVVNNKGLKEIQVNTSASWRSESWETWLVVTWEKSDLRAWLNAEFYSNAFSDSEKAQIIQATVANLPTEPWSDGCPDTLDNVHIPSLREIDEAYRRASLTKYAKNRARNTYYDLYWLRTNMAEDADKDAPDIRYYDCDRRSVQTQYGGDLAGIEDNVGVRPAIWVATDAAAIHAETADDGKAVLDEAHFPDPVFRSCALQYDADRNGTLSEDELSTVKTLLIDHASIKSLKGIEYFSELIMLDCTGNALTELDLSHAGALEYLYCANNGLNSLSVADNEQLKELDCSGNHLTALDVAECHQLRWLVCRDNGLVELTLGSKPELNGLYAQGNSMKKLNISGCEQIDEFVETASMTRFDPETDDPAWGNTSFIYYGEDFRPGFPGLGVDESVRLLLEDVESDTFKEPLYASIDQTDHIVVHVGDIVQMTYGSTVLDAGWTSDAPDIAFVSRMGCVSGIGIGTATVTGALSNGEAVVINVTVTSSPENVLIAPEFLTLARGERSSLSATVLPAESDTGITWKSLDSRVAIVGSDGTVCAVNSGETQIVAISDDGIQAACAVTVTGEGMVYGFEDMGISSVEVTPKWTCPGNSLTWTVETDEGSGAVNCSFEIIKDGTPIMTITEGNANSARFTPKEEGRYAVRVTINGSGQSFTFEGAEALVRDFSAFSPEKLEQEITLAFNQIVSAWSDEAGCVAEEDQEAASMAFYSMAQSLEEQKIIKKCAYCPEGSTVVIYPWEGGATVYALKSEATYSGGGGEYSVMCFETLPVYQNMVLQALGAISNYGIHGACEAAEYIYDHLKDDYTTLIKMGETYALRQDVFVLRDCLQSIDDLQIRAIFWRGHGGIISGDEDKKQIVLTLSQGYLRGLVKDGAYKEEYETGRIMKMEINASLDSYFAVTSRFFDTYLPDNIDGGIFVCGACDSNLSDCDIGDIFIGHGFDLYLGTSGEIFTGYSDRFLGQLAKHLCEMSEDKTDIACYGRLKCFRQAYLDTVDDVGSVDINDCEFLYTQKDEDSISNFRLVDSARLNFAASDRRGDIPPGIRVHVTDEEGTDYTLDMDTDSIGRFVGLLDIPVASFGNCDISIAADHFETLYDTVDVEGDTQFDYTLRMLGISSGRVLDRETGMPIENVQVECHLAEDEAVDDERLPISIYTDASGNFSIDRLDCGRYTFRFSREGYTPEERTLEFNGYSWKQFIEIKLVAKQCTVTFDANGGMCSVATARVDRGNTMGALPIAVRNDYEFAGWNTQSDGLGDFFTSDIPVMNNITLYAQWNANTVVELSDYLGRNLTESANAIGGLQRFTREQYEYTEYGYEDVNVELIASGYEDDIYIIQIDSPSKYALMGLQVGMSSDSLNPFLDQYEYLVFDKALVDEEGLKYTFDMGDSGEMYLMRFEVDVAHDAISRLRYDWGITNG